MKKTLLGILTLILAIIVPSACSENERDDSNRKSTITINKADLYNTLGIKDSMLQVLKSGQYVITDSVLIYDHDGNLAAKLGSESKNLNPLIINVEGLADGTYTLLAWQTAKYDNKSNYWRIFGQDKLSTVNIQLLTYSISYNKALGYVSAGFSVEGGVFEAIELSPEPIGKILDICIDNFTPETGYVSVSLWNDTHCYGMYLDPSVSEDNRWLIADEYSDLVARINVGKSHARFFTIEHGNSVNMSFYGDLVDSNDEFLSYYSNLNFDLDRYSFCYLDMNSLNIQPPFYGSAQELADWKAQRDEGILVSDPMLDWGCDIKDVWNHILAKQWWATGDTIFEFWAEEYNCWHLWFYVAPKLTEQYFFETQQGENLRYAMSYCWDSDVSIEVAHFSLKKQGYQYKGQIQRPGDNIIYNLFLSADGLTEALTNTLKNNYGDDVWRVVYQPVNSNDLQLLN